MRNPAFQLCLLLTILFCSSGQLLRTTSAGECNACRGPYGGKTPPCDDTGCGPRYWGAFCDEPFRPDPCNCRNEWAGGCFQSPSLDLLAPWQMPPGKGFWSPKQCGYATEHTCQTCGPRGWLSFWKPRCCSARGCSAAGCSARGCSK